MPTSRTTSLDADELVDACRAVLAQVGEGDELAISCFWHSLVAARRARPAADAGPHLAGRRRRAARARPGRLPPPHRLLPASLVLAGEDPAPAGRRRPGRPLPLVRRLPAAAAGRRAARRASRWRAAPASSIRTGSTGTTRRSTRSRSSARSCRRSRTSRSPASGRRSATAPARTSARAASSAARAAVMIGTSAAARVVYAAASAEPRPGLFLYRLDKRPLLRGRRALGRREPARLAPADAARRSRRRARRAPGGRRTGSSSCRFSAASGRSAGTRSGAVRSAGSRSRRRRSTSRRPRSRASATGSPTSLDALGGVESVVATGGALLASPRLGADPRRRARPPGRGLGRRRGLGARRCDRSRSSGPACRFRPRRSRASSSRAPGGIEIHLAARAEQRDDESEERT